MNVHDRTLQVIHTNAVIKVANSQKRNVVLDDITITPTHTSTSAAKKYYIQFLPRISH